MDNNNLTTNNIKKTDYNNQKIIQIPLTDIKPNPFQPRLLFSDDKLSALASSISQYGVLQPIVVTEKKDASDNIIYEIIAGERRYRASKIAGLTTIPAVVASDNLQNSDKFELAIIENIQREDLNPVEKAKAFKKLHEEFSLTHSQIAEKMGKSREYVSNSIRLLELPDKILDAIAKSEIAEGHSKPLLILKDRPFEQNILFEKIKDKKLTVRAADTLAKKLLSGEKEIIQIGDKNNQFKIIEKKLSEKLGTKVSINTKEQGNGGKLTIEFFSKEDLNKIVSLVRGEGLQDVNSVLNSEENKNSYLKEDIKNINKHIQDNIDKKNNINKKINIDLSEQTKKDIEISQKPTINLENKEIHNPIAESEKKEEKKDNINKIEQQNNGEEEKESKDSLGGFNIASFLNKKEAVKVVDDNTDLFKEDIEKEKEEKKDNINKIEQQNNGEEEKESKDSLGGFNIASFLNKKEAVKVIDDNTDLFKEDIEKEKEEKKEEINNFGDFSQQTENQIQNNIPENQIQTPKVESKIENQPEVESIFQTPQETLKTENQIQNNIPENQIQTPKVENNFSGGDFLSNKDKLEKLDYEKGNKTVFGNQEGIQEKINSILEKTGVATENKEEVNSPQIENQKFNTVIKKDNIENTSMYEQFLKSKEKISQQQDDVFTNKIQNQKEEQSIFTKPQKEEKIEKKAIENIYKESEPLSGNENIDLINEGSDFMPKSNKIELTEDSKKSDDTQNFSL